VTESYAAGAATRYREGEGATALERAARYSCALERSLIRMLHEIERVQASTSRRPTSSPTCSTIGAGAECSSSSP
jgi:hypothetical protein